MSREDLVLAVAGILFVAFLIGWFCHWLVSRITRSSKADMGDLDRMAHELHEAEDARDQAVTYMQQREAQLSNQLHQTEAELKAAMDGLRAARHEAEELCAYIERANQGDQA